MSPTSIVAYLMLFAGAAFAFLFATLLLGRFLRAHDRSPEKLETYECGEPPVGSSYVQFDLRFYVMALVFIIFEVEVAFFFPWAVVYGKATQLMGVTQSVTAANITPESASKIIARRYAELGVSGADAASVDWKTAGDDARTLGLAALVEMLGFFAILLVGFAYVWSRGDLDWVRAMGRREGMTRVEPPAELTAAGSQR